MATTAAERAEMMDCATRLMAEQREALATAWAQRDALLADAKAVLADETVDCGRDECGLYTHVAPCPLADLRAAITKAESNTDICPNYGEHQPDDAEFIAEHGRCWTCNDFADDARGGVA